MKFKIDKYKRIFLGIGYLLTFGMGFCFLNMFIVCYLFSPSKTVLVGLNWIGEANIEFAIICCCIPFMVFAFFNSVHQVKNIKRRGVI